MMIDCFIFIFELRFFNAVKKHGVPVYRAQIWQRSKTLASFDVLLIWCNVSDATKNFLRLKLTLQQILAPLRIGIDRFHQRSLAWIIMRITFALLELETGDSLI